ncbi:unnamed protein product [Prunus armeniaca]|uniref:Uncharacterized protein n=1 Tax=Prunus armeniaca TaxID=36596 RepID=A0A6J5U9M1_PRUAR|nr:unnamed protein product [Prunus armeniaca]
MAPKKSKLTKVSADAPDWISGQSAAKHAEEFQAVLVHEQSKSSVRFYSPFPLSLRGPFKTPFLGPHYHQVKPESLLALDTQLVRVPFPYDLQDIDWGSGETNLERLGSSPDVPLCRKGLYSDNLELYRNTIFIQVLLG